MSFEIDQWNTGKESTNSLYHLETIRDWQGREVEMPVYDIPVDTRIAMASARLAKERQRPTRWGVELPLAA